MLSVHALDLFRSKFVFIKNKTYFRRKVQKLIMLGIPFELMKVDGNIFDCVALVHQILYVHTLAKGIKATRFNAGSSV